MRRRGSAVVLPLLLLLLTSCGLGSGVSLVQVQVRPVQQGVELSIPVPIGTSVYLHASGQPTRLILDARDNDGQVRLQDGQPNRTYRVTTGQQRVLLSYRLERQVPDAVTLSASSGTDEVVVASVYGGYHLSLAKTTAAAALRYVATPRGLVWSPPPADRGGKPGPRGVYLSAPKATVLATATARLACSLPSLVAPRNGATGQRYLELTSLQAAGDWVLYTAAVRAPGAKSASYDLLGACSLTGGKPQVLTLFHATGNTVFELAQTDSHVFWVETQPAAGVTLTVAAEVANLATGAVHRLPLADLQGTPNGLAVAYPTGGRVLRVTLLRYGRGE